MSLLTLIGDAMQICGLSRPATVYGSSDGTVSEFLLWSKIEGDDLALMDWPQLKTLISFSGDGSSTEFNLPVDFTRWIGGNPLYIDGEANGPLQNVTDEEMLRAKAQSFSPVRPIWRRAGDIIEFYPSPESTDVIKGEYRSQYWIVDSLGQDRKPEWDADNNEALLPYPVMKIGTAWRWKRSKGLYYEDLKADYDRLRYVHFANQTGRKDVKLSTVYPSDMPMVYNEPTITVP